MSKYNDMKEHFEHRIEQLQKDIDMWRRKALDAAYRVGECELYEKILNRLLRDAVDNDTYILNGKVYKAVSYTLDHDIDRGDTLSVDFVRVYIPEGDKK